jgi:hypothetical protein
VIANRIQEDEGPVTFSREVGGESCSRAALSGEIWDDQDITPSYATKIVTETGDILLPVVTPTQISQDKLVGHMHEGYALDAALSELSTLECFRFTSEEPITQIRSASIDIQVCTSQPQKFEPY